jgi:S1-C subfamily serine protease
MAERRVRLVPSSVASQARRVFLSAGCLALLLLGAAPLLSDPALARGPASVADIAEGLQDSVVNISTTQTLKGSKDESSVGPGPKGSPFEEFFDDFFDDEEKAPTRSSPASPTEPNSRSPRFSVMTLRPTSRFSRSNPRSRFTP